MGEGGARQAGRAVDWSATPLGPVEEWPRPLRDVVRTCLESPFPIALWCGPELTLVYNDAYRSVLGDKHPAAMGRPGPEVWSEIWEHIAPLFDRIREGGAPVYQQDAPFRIRRSEDVDPDPPTGRPNAWITFGLSPVRSESGEILAFLNIATESTRRVMAEQAQEDARAKAERAERRLKDVFADAPAFMAVLRGKDHVFEYVNSAYYRLVGRRDLLGRPVFEALPEVRGQGFEALLDRVLETGEPFIGREVAFSITPTESGEPEERYVDLVYYPITEADGSRSGVVAHGSDVTEHVRARRAAQQARAEAEQANQAKSQFLATMSHEIRTPINAVMGYADLLDAGIAGPLQDDQQRYVEGIQTSSRHLLGLVSDILDLAKIEAGEMVVGAHEMRVQEVVEAALRIIRPQADEQGLTVEETWDCARDTEVVGDPDRIRQILLNLLSNALKFTDAGGTITVRCRSADTAPQDTALPGYGPWIVLEVEDTGRGIPLDQLGRVFEPFVQGESGHTRRSGGTGLGLTISRRLARLMAGELTASSEVGVGSRFSLWLTPAVQERVAMPLPDGDAPPAWPPEPHELPGLASAGRALLSSIESAEQEWVNRLRTDPIMRAAERVNRAQVADQTAELIAAFSKVLFVLEEGGGDPALLKDAEAVLHVIARRHGQQRRRLGWARPSLEREYRILAEVLDAALRQEAPKRTAANLGTALTVLHRLVARAAATSLVAFGDVGAPDLEPDPVE